MGYNGDYYRCVVCGEWAYCNCLEEYEVEGYEEARRNELGGTTASANGRLRQRDCE
jgi:hypothetical protein